MANVAYNKGKAIIGGTADWTDGGQTYRCLLATTTYSPNMDDNFVADVTNELSGGGYVRKDLATRSITEDDTNDRADYIADNVTWTGLSSVQTYRWVVIYRFVTNDADSPLICALDLTAVNLTSVTDHTIKWDGGAANGRVFSIT